MALAVTTDLTPLTTAETTTGWTAIGAQSPALEPDFFAQGSNCISRAVSNAAKGMVFDNGAGIDFTTGTHKDKLVYAWMRCNTPSLADTRANGGIVVRLATGGATSNYRDWYVDGSDTIQANDGWVCYVIDPQSAGSVTSGSYSAANVRYYGGYMTAITTAKGQNFGIDQISYGRGELRVAGTVTTSGRGFSEIAAADFGTVNNRWGIITEKAGVFYVRGKIVLGHATSNTTFSSRGETVVFETPEYKSATDVVKAIPDASVGATAGSDGQTTYNGIGIIGGSGTTAVDLGVIVGTDNGRSGSAFVCAAGRSLTTPGRTKATVSVSDASMALSVYASTFTGFEGVFDLHGTNVSGDDCFGNTFNGCGRLRSNMEMRNCTILNSVAAADDGAYLWESTSNVQSCLFVNNSRAIVFESATGSPFSFTGIKFGGNVYDVRNESGAAITINVAGGGTPTYENIGGGSATTVNNTVSVTLTGLVDPTEVRVYTRDGSGNNDTEIAGGESVTTGSFAFSAEAGVHVNIVIFSVGYQPADIYDYIVPSQAASIPVQQIFDRVYVNP